MTVSADEKSDSPVPLHLYRFRSAEAVLDSFHELENQEIYLASPEELNDPMEGYNELQWLGDAVLWRNQLRHYLLNLVCAAAQLELMGEAWEEPIIDGFRTLDDVPAPLRKIVVEVSSAFFADPSVSAALTQLAELNKPLGTAGVTFCLSSLHAIATRTVFAVLAAHGLSSADAASVPGPHPISPSLHDLLSMLRTEGGEIETAHLELVMDVGRRVHQELSLMHRYNAGADLRLQKAAYLAADFPTRYVAQISQALIHPPWFTACFSDTATNASMWGSYGASHSGVALKFRAMALTDGRPGIELEGVAGVSQRKGQAPVPVRKKIRHRFHKVTYAADPPVVDFFRFLGRLPWPKYLSTWLSDDLGGRSERLKDAFVDQQSWRNELRGLFTSGATRKLPDWAFEREYRLVATDLLGLRAQAAEHRKLRYSFASLQGIVFGLRTRTEHKLRIIEILERKCRQAGRTDFEFAQAHYSSAKQQIEIVPMTLLRFSKEPSEDVAPPRQAPR